MAEGLFTIEDWQRKAACLGDTEFTNKPFSEALKTCADCPVKVDCLERGLKLDDRYRVYGGTTPLQRRGLRAGLREILGSERPELAKEEIELRKVIVMLGMTSRILAEAFVDERQPFGFRRGMKTLKHVRKKEHIKELLVAHTYYAEGFESAAS